MVKRVKPRACIQGAALWLGAVMIAFTGAAAAVPVADFALLDHEGRYHQLSYYSDQPALVLMTHRSSGSAADASLAQFARLREAYAGQPVRFFLIDAHAGATRAQLAADAQRRSLSVPVLLDSAQLVAEALALSQVGELLVVNPQAMTLTHRTALTAANAPAVRAALDALLGGEPAPVSAAALATAAPARQIRFPGRLRDQREPVSYVRDIVPILEDNCVACHQEGGIAPWAMNSHRMVQGFALMIKEVVATRRMPPGQIDQHVSKAIRDVAGLTAEEQQKLFHWIDAGAPMDGDKDPLTAIVPKSGRFTMGEPDLIYRIPAQEIPATGLVDYRYIPLKLNLDEDIWVRGMEFVPGDRQVLHHVIAYVQSPADRSREGRRDTVARGESVGGFAPGRVGEDFGAEGGRLLQKGANLLLQMHYTTSGKATVDETEIGIYLHDKPPKYVMSEVVAAQRRFMVPPHVSEHRLTGEQLIERDAYLHAMMPHMHYRGKYMNYSAAYPDGTEELLLSVPKYDFNWQFNYQLVEPIFLPAGTRLIARGAMDNSAQNRGNPDPSQPVHFGLQTQHEMFFGFTTLRYLDVEPQVAVLEGEGGAGE
jgi:hypothetical protein